MTRRPREGGRRGKGRNEQESGLCPSEKLQERMKRVEKKQPSILEEFNVTKHVWI